MDEDRVTCAFVRHDCAHTELFQANYQRTNRTRGSKILRCYPHCCPHHVTRSFCGAPLYVDVHWDRAGHDATATVPSVVVFARFRLQQELGHATGDLVSKQRIAASIQSDDHPNAVWIQSVAINQPSTAAASTLAWRFEINSSARWFYGWESGVAKSHRLREHVLEVVVATPTVGADHTDTNYLRIVGLLLSPPFKMISFRRATPTAMTLLAKSSAPTVGVPRRVSDATSPHVHEQIQRQRQTRQLQRDQWIQQLIARSGPELRTHTAARPQTPDLAVQLQDLVTVWTYVHSVALRSVLPLAPLLETAFWKHWNLARCVDPHGGHTHPLQRRRRGPVDHTLARLLQDTAIDSEAVRGRKRAAPSPLLKITVHTALWLCWDRELAHEWRQLVDDATELVLDAGALRTRVETVVVEWAWWRLDAFLSEMDWTLPALVAAMREVPCVDASTPTVDGDTLFASFVAHVRERLVDQERKRRRMRRRIDASPVSTVASSEFDGHWVTSLDDIRIRPHEPPPATPPWKLAHLLWFWRHLGGLTLRFHPHSLALELASAFHPDDGGPDPATVALVLDHRCRWLRRFPGSESTLAMALDGQRFGDYVGKVAASHREFHVNLYAWPTTTASCRWASCYQVHVAAPPSMGDKLRVTVSVNRGELESGPDLDDLETRPLPQRLALVKQWTASATFQLEYTRDVSR